MNRSDKRHYYFTPTERILEIERKRAENVPLRYYGWLTLFVILAFIFNLFLKNQ